MNVFQRVKSPCPNDISKTGPERFKVANTLSKIKYKSNGINGCRHASCECKYSNELPLSKYEVLARMSDKKSR